MIADETSIDFPITFNWHSTKWQKIHEIYTENNELVARFERTGSLFSNKKTIVNWQGLEVGFKYDGGLKDGLDILSSGDEKIGKYTDDIGSVTGCFQRFEDNKSWNFKKVGSILKFQYKIHDGEVPICYIEILEQKLQKMSGIMKVSNDWKNRSFELASGFYIAVQN